MTRKLLFYSFRTRVLQEEPTKKVNRFLRTYLPRWLEKTANIWQSLDNQSQNLLLFGCTGHEIILIITAERETYDK